MYCNIKINWIVTFYLQWWIIQSEAVSKKWPSRYPRCSRNDPNLNKCILEATEIMKPFLKQGIPEFNMAPISPFFIPELSIQQGTDALNYKVTLKNVTILGFDSYKFDKFDFDVDNLLFDAALTIDALYVDATFDVSGKILTVPIEGRGIMKGNISTSSGTLQSKATLVTKKGETYIQSAEKPVVKLNFGKVTDHYINGLFDGNELLAKTAYKVIDENLQDLVEEIKPALEEVVGEIILDILNKSLAKVPYDESFPVHSDT